MRKLLVHFHLYYHEQIDYFIKKLSNINSCEWDLYVTYVKQNRKSFEKLKKLKPDVKLVKVNNVGYDVWPFIQVIKMVDLSIYDCVLKIHTKRNLGDYLYLGENYKYNGKHFGGSFWKNSLIDSLLKSSAVFKKNFELIANKKYGMIVSKPFFIKLEPPESVNFYLLENLKEKLGVCSNMKYFIAGTMFMISPKALEKIKKYPVREIDFGKCSESNSDSSLAHSYERVFALCVNDIHMKIYKRKNKRLFLWDFVRFLRNILSIYNSQDKTHKILKIFGFKFKIKKYKRTQEIEEYMNWLYYLKNDKSCFVPITEKPFVRKKNTPKIFAYYLPQYHSIPENDFAYGKGFTEWNNVSTASPLFAGHYQPKIPYDVGFYNLNDEKVIERQIELAKMYGIYGFCFSYYWFSGKKLLDKPLEKFLKSNLDFHFHLCWANENWSKLWDGGNKEVIMKQNCESIDSKKFFNDLLPYISDNRYEKIGNKPILMIYRPTIFKADVIKTFLSELNILAKEYGFDGFYFACSNYSSFNQPKSYGLDAIIEFPPHDLHNYCTQINQASYSQNAKFIMWNITTYLENTLFIASKNIDGDYFKCCFPSWDNTPRKAYSGSHIFPVNKHQFKTWLSKILDWTIKQYPVEKQYVYINAWNEWAEGAMLEPDCRYGYEHLNTVKECLEELEKSKGEK